MSLDSLPPLLITACIEPAAFRYFDSLRRQYFPPARNHLAAHITLFHRLPGEEQAAILNKMQAALALQSALMAEVYAVGMLGNAVVYRLRAPALGDIRQALAQQFSPWLSRQDAAAWQPHITVQNKVPIAQAQATLATLAKDFQPMTISITGLQLWAYLGGPWQLITEKGLPLT